MTLGVDETGPNSLRSRSEFLQERQGNARNSLRSKWDRPDSTGSGQHWSDFFRESVGLVGMTLGVGRILVCISLGMAEIGQNSFSSGWKWN